MLSFSLSDINARAERDPAAFVEECEEDYRRHVEYVARRIAKYREKYPVVLLSGPSGSGKTTTAKKVCDALETLGICANTVSLDHYFKTLDPKTAPRTPEGGIDYESPMMLDLELLNEHFHMLAHGEEILVPYFNFKTQSRREDKTMRMKISNDEVAIFEGIHALNSMITDKHPDATRLYISARSNVEDNGKVFFKGTWMRILRRVVRDNNFRGTGASETLQMWANVRRGEKRNISPFKNTAHIKFDSSRPHEVSVMKRFALSAMIDIPRGTERRDEIGHMFKALDQFCDIDDALVPEDSIIREFIGGGKYEY